MSALMTSVPLPTQLALTPGPMELVILLVVVLLLFGNRLPGAMKSLGQSFVAFKKGIKEGEEDPVTHDADTSRLK